MQKALTPKHPTENDCFAGDAIEDAEETDIPMSSVSIGGRPLCNLQLADDIDLQEAVKKNSNNSVKDWKKRSDWRKHTQP